MPGPPFTRRRFLGAIGLATSVGLAGCSGVTSQGDQPTAGGGNQTTTTGETTDSTPGGEPGPLALRPVATGFDAPLDLADAPGSDLRYVADQTGAISTVGPDGSVEPFLDLADQIVTGGERGLLGLALHPGFAENRKLYVRYSSPSRPGTPSDFSHTFVLSEFVAGSDGMEADPDTERVLLEIPEPQSNHNSGAIVFGPDGYLYVGVGDGGGGGDVGTGHADDWYGENPGGNGQDVADNLLGSILRIDVDERSSSASQTASDAVDGQEADRAYGIPDDNPLVGEVGLDEHYAWGFRNPWRMSFDGEDLYVGDVGESAYEEIDLVRRGGNYGWNVKEGTQCFGPEDPPDDCPDETADGEPLVDPIVEYPHSDAAVSGISIIGGYVYRGNAIPGLADTYVFGDLETGGRLFAAEPTDGGGLWPTTTVPIAESDRDDLQQLLSFGRDGDGRLYVLGTGADDGGVYELQPAE